jgi:hypothetical protein
MSREVSANLTKEAVPRQAAAGGRQELSRYGAMVVSGRGQGAGQTSPRQALLVKSKTRGKAALYTTFNSQRDPVLTP